MRSEEKSFKWGNYEYTTIQYKPSKTLRSLPIVSLIIPDFGLFAFLGVALNNPVPLRYRCKITYNKIKKRFRAFVRA